MLKEGNENCPPFLGDLRVGTGGFDLAGELQDAPHEVLVPPPPRGDLTGDLEFDLLGNLATSCPPSERFGDERGL